MNRVREHRAQYERGEATRKLNATREAERARVDLRQREYRQQHETNEFQLIQRPKGRIMLMTRGDAKTFAASSATEEEELIAKTGRLPDGTKPVQVPKRVWRPQVKNIYEEPEFDLPDASSLDWAYRTLGKTMLQNKIKVPDTRSNLIEFKPEIYDAEFDQNIQWRDCPNTIQPAVEAIIKEYWDCFAKEGMKDSILGFEFNIDTGKSKPICCKQPRYGPHEARVMQKLVDQLEEKGLIEDDHGPIACSGGEALWKQSR